MMSTFRSLSWKEQKPMWVSSLFRSAWKSRVDVESNDYLLLSHWPNILWAWCRYFPKCKTLSDLWGQYLSLTNISLIRFSGSNATNLNNVYTRFVLAIALQISHVFYLGNVFKHQSQRRWLLLPSFGVGKGQRDDDFRVWNKVSMLWMLPSRTNLLHVRL